MPSPTRRPVACAWLLACGCALAAEDPALLGCWRGQQSQTTLADKSDRQQNADCATEYDAKYVRSRCQSDSGRVDLLSSYELVSPGRIRWTQLDAATRQPKGPTAEAQYRIDGEWLLIERSMSGVASSAPEGKQPILFRSVSIRVPVGSGSASRCEPLGDTGLRIGRTSKSSLSMNSPAGWEPRLIDPSANQNFAEAVRSNFLIGIFAPRQAQAASWPEGILVLMVDETRSGPIPVRAAEFAEVKRKFRSDLAPDPMDCDQPDRICGRKRFPDGSQVYTQLVNVKGRVAIIHAAVHGFKSDQTAALRAAVRQFVDQLLLTNSP